MFVDEVIVVVHSSLPLGDSMHSIECHDEHCDLDIESIDSLERGYAAETVVHWKMTSDNSSGLVSVDCIYWIAYAVVVGIHGASRVIAVDGICSLDASHLAVSVDIDWEELAAVVGYRLVNDTGSLDTDNRL